MSDMAEIKQLVEKVDLSTFQNAMLELLDPDMELAVGLDYIFQKIYLHACLKGRIDIAEWLATEFFIKLSPIEQIAIRQVFPYGRHLLTKAMKKC